MENFALEINNLKKVYAGGTIALKNISFHVKEGDFYALLGPNGAGKSSTIGIIGTLVTKTSGNVKIFGYDIDESVASAKSMLGVVSQEINFSQFEKVIDIVTTQAGFYGIKKSVAEPKVKIMLQKLGLWDKRNDQARTLSGGYKRRLMIAKALIHEPKLLILDEPTAALTPQETESLFKTIKIMVDKGLSVILISHKLNEVLSISNRIIVLRDGKKVGEKKTIFVINENKISIFTICLTLR